MEIVFKKTAAKQLLKLPKPLAIPIEQKIRQLTAPPANFNIKKLSGQDEYRLRIGDYRVVYSINHHSKEIVIHAIAHRREVYR